MSNHHPIHVIGGGLAGCEAAWQAARAGVPVVLHEMRPTRPTDAHKTDSLAELVCSNSFRSDDAMGNAVGVIHREMRRLGSLVMACADRHQVPAGGALAVDRDGFAEAMTRAIAEEPLIELRREAIDGLPPEEWSSVIVATGPLTSPGLALAIAALGGEDQLAFFDAIAPIVHKESIDFDKAWYQSRYDKVGPGGNGLDYINCPLDKAQYEAFVDALLTRETTSFKQWEGTPYFNGCLPIEVMAERGRETLRHGPMKPVGLTNPRDPLVKAYGIVQLRQDNALGTLYNMVGFQTKLKHAAQVEVFRTIPGLERAEFARLGGLHRNTFINSPRLLDGRLRLKVLPRLRFAGQITGCEGYVESAAVGLMAGAPGGGRAPRRDSHHATGHDRHRGADQPHHGRPRRDDRCRAAVVPADERQLRAFPAARRGAPLGDGEEAPRTREGQSQQAGDESQGGAGPGGLVGRSGARSRRGSLTKLSAFSREVGEGETLTTCRARRGPRRTCGSGPTAGRRPSTPWQPATPGTAGRRGLDPARHLARHGAARRRQRHVDGDELRIVDLDLVDEPQLVDVDRDLGIVDGLERRHEPFGDLIELGGRDRGGRLDLRQVGRGGV